MKNNYWLKKRYKTLVAFCTFCFVSYSQSYIIKGVVTDNNATPIEYFNAVLLSSVDSSLVVGGAFFEGEFSLEYKLKQPLLLKMSGLGYKNLYKLLPESIPNIFETDTLHLEPVSLDEITVLAKRPVFSHNGGNLNIIVKSTILEDAGSALDVLKLSPGLLIDNSNNILIFGKGIPLIIIDGREISSRQELETLQSNQIDRISIDRNPSAQYSSSARAVIIIETLQRKSDQLSLQLFNSVAFAREICNKSGFSINAKQNKLSGFINYVYATNNYRNNIEAYENNILSDYTINNESYSVEESSSNNHNLMLGSEYVINEASSFNFIYNLSLENDYVDQETDQIIQKADDAPITRQIFQDGDDNNYLHNFSLGYKVSPDSIRKFIIQTDYARKSAEGATNISEKNINNGTASCSILDNKNTYDVFTIKSEYNYPVYKGLNMLTGARMAFISNNGRTQLTESNINGIRYSDKQNITDRIMAAYLLTEKKSGDIFIEGGIRTEYTQTKVMANSIDVLDSTYLQFFPSMNFNVDLSEEIAIALNYNKKISRPDFNELDPSVVYFDSLSYGQGNPTLKPSIIHSIAFDIELPFSLYFSAEYNYTRNTRIVSALNDNINPHIIKYTPINIDKSRYLEFGLSYSYSGKRFSTNTSCYVEFPYVNIPYLNTLVKQRTPGWYFASSNDYTFGKIFTFYCNLSYQSRNVELMTEYEPSCNIKTGIKGKFFNKKLLVSLDANNIFKTDKSEWNDKYGNITSGQKTNYDNRYIRISLRYNFNDFKSNNKHQNGNEDELNRL